MKMNIKAFALVLSIGVLISSCEKTLEQYSGLDYIQFVSEYESDSLNYCFGLAGKSDKDTIGIEVAVTGEVVNYDRVFSLSVNHASTAKEGVHFNIPRQNKVVHANHVTDTLWIEVFNSEELKKSEVYLQLDLVENENFQLCFPESNSCKIYLTDEITRPEWWNEWHETEGLGTYSEKKYRLFIQVCGIYDLGATVEYPERREAILKFKYYLEEEADKGNVIMDGDEPMSVAMYG